ncbi:hypothetical protein, partial [Pararobbsia alpina]|uniref:hypothetical protein n=1 Tax=Pararobbsia alpina TaxID=621374 RepID=UPI001C2ED463
VLFKSGALIGRYRKGLLFHPDLTIRRPTALTFFSVAPGRCRTMTRPQPRAVPVPIGSQGRRWHQSLCEQLRSEKLERMSTLFRSSTPLV